jgi:hypothetical protein
VPDTRTRIGATAAFHTDDRVSAARPGAKLQPAISQPSRPVEVFHPAQDNVRHIRTTAHQGHTFGHAAINRLCASATELLTCMQRGGEVNCV